MSYSVIINEPVGGLTDRTSYVNIGDAGSNNTFTLQLGQRGSGNITFIVRAGDSYYPTVGSPIYLYQGTQCVFAGTIDSLETNWLGNAGDFTVILTLVSLEGCFDNILIPPRSYVGVTAGYIVNDLFSNVCAGVPITAGTISAGPTIVAPVIFSWDSVSSAYDNLATLAGFSWYVDPATSELMFCLPDTTAAPFTVTGDNTIWESMDWLQTRTDYRNMQVARLSFSAFPPSNQVFSAGSLTYNVNWPIDSIVQAILTTSVRASSAWTMHSVPSPGDTVTVGSAVYTWVSTLDNTVEFCILIGASTGDCSFHLQHAIDADPNYAGIQFSLPTWENGLFNGGEIPSSSSTTAWVKVPGAAGNSYPVASSNPSSLSWSSSTATGGSDGVTTTLQVGLASDVGTSNDLTYTQGSTLVTLAVAAPTYLSVVYWRTGADCIAVQNDSMVAARAAIEHGTGKYQLLTDDSSETVLQQGLTFARAALSSYSSLPITFYFYTNTYGMSPGLWATLDYVGPAPANLAALVNGTWLVQEVDATLLPGSQIWQYQVYVVNATVVNYLNFWLNLLGGSGGGGGSATASGGGGGGSSNPAPIVATLTGPYTPTFPTASDGQDLYVQLTQDGTGGRAVTWPSGVMDAPEIDSSAGTADPNTYWSISFSAAAGSWWCTSSILR